jgi:hypothetical protein
LKLEKAACRIFILTSREADARKGLGNGSWKYGSKHTWISETGTWNNRKYKLNDWKTL